ncbi:MULTISPECIES: hypothetical protein [Paraburkholderia]|uniref:hypothetical protein n=1 Tax=Paraburkholderia TaxID=1822464 RepID=UPI002AB78588|nr:MULTISPECIES: hypothetical protein [Paraburkholderia]
MSTEDEPKVKRSWRLFRFSSIVAALAAAAALFGNVKTLSEPFTAVSSFVGERLAAVILRQPTIRIRLAKALLADRDAQRLACFDSANPIDLDGNGVKSDVAVLFRRALTPGDCQNAGPLDAAFYQWSWTGFKFVGDPPLPDGLTAWNFVGPAAFREAADSSYPVIHIFMLRDGQISDVGQIDTVTAEEYAGTDYVATDDGKAAWVVTAASISKVSFDRDGKPLIQRLDGKALVAQNQGLDLLSYSPEGILSFDGEPLSEDSPKAGDQFDVRMSPGYRLYLLGCKPVNGLDAASEVAGAYSMNFASNPSVSCALGEESAFNVKISPKEF